MNLTKYTLTALITATLTAPFTYAAPACDTNGIIQTMEKRLDKITDYRVTIKSVINTQKPSEMELASKRPNLLKATMQVADTDKLVIVYDKKNQWIEEGNMVYKIDLSKSTKRTPERPFDTDYSLAGGLLSGEDYVGTVKALLSIYDLKATCKANNIVLKGKIDIPKFTEYTKTRNIDIPIDDFIKAFANTLTTATIVVDKKSYLISGYILEGTDRFKATFSNYDFSPLTNDQLKYTIPEGVKPVDISPGAPPAGPIPATDDHTASKN